MWHLLIPPIMLMLDDYEVQYKIQGVKLVSQLSKTVPPELLKRTGVDALLLAVSLFVSPSLKRATHIYLLEHENSYGLPP